MTPLKITAKVAAKTQLTAKIYEVKFQLVNPDRLEFQAGQNLMLMIAPGINRAMSIASPPSQKNQLLMVADISPMGPGSVWTLNLKEGQEVNFLAPTGGDLMMLGSDRKKVFVATGTGIAPFRAMILDYLEHGGKAQIELYWGLRFEEDLYWQEEFKAISKSTANFQFHLILSKPTANWQGTTGHVTEHVLSEVPDLPSCDFYLCGNKTMVSDVRDQLLSKNVPKEQIKTELFY